MTRRMAVGLGLCAWVFAVSGCRETGATEPALVLTEAGVALAPVVLFADAPPMTRQVAEELIEYIEKTSGARPELIEGTPDPLPESAIWVGVQPVLHELFPELDFEFEHPEEILISANDRHLVIAGRDRWDPEDLVATVRWGRKVDGRQQEYGTVNAVYTFLQDYLGVRWLWPGDTGEDVPETGTIAFEPFSYRYYPQMRYRNEAFYFSSFHRMPTGGRSVRWNRRQRLLLDSLDMNAGGHAFADWWGRFHESNPEYFALQPDGSRSGHPSPGRAKLCKSNPAVAEQWLADVEKILEENPNQMIFSAAANDGWMSGYCVCPDCLAMDHPDGEPRRFTWQGLNQEYVAISDRHVTFTNRCARLLRERFPEKDYYVWMHAYGHTRPAPIAAVPDDNVIISSVHLFFGRPEKADRGSIIGSLHRDQFDAWAKVSPHITWRPNLTGNWHMRALPMIGLTQAMDDYRFISERGAIGFFSVLNAHWATQGPLYYLTAQLVWDPRQDGRKVLDDYYRRGFGPAAGAIADYWQMMDEVTESLYNGGAQYPSDEVIFGTYDGQFFERGYGYLDQATEALKGEKEIFSKRLEFVRAGLDYTRLVADSWHRLQLAREGSEEEKAAAEERMRTNWATIKQINADFPEALSWHWVNTRFSSINPDR